MRVQGHGEVIGQTRGALRKPEADIENHKQGFKTAQVSVERKYHIVFSFAVLLNSCHMRDASHFSREAGSVQG